MKTYHIRFTENDFVSKTSKTVDAFTTRYIWRTPVYDLYDNPQYKNYSVKRSNYGTNLLSNGVYTGLNKYSPTASDIGYVSSGRFVDTSGRVDIIDWKSTFDVSIQTGVASSLSVFTTDFKNATPYYTHATPNAVSDWAIQNNVLAGRSIFNIDSSRYVFFELSFDVDSGISISGKQVETIISIVIDPPVVDGYFPATKQIQDKFPEWMALREYDPAIDPTDLPATPGSVGGKFLNAVAGEWLSDLTAKIKYQEFQFHVDTVDITQKAWVYITEGVEDLIWSITGDGIQLARTSNLEEFYTSQSSDYSFFWNRTTKEIFTNDIYTSLLINGVKVYQKPYRVWNSLDDIGVSVDLFRIQSATPTGYLENNDSFRKRILDVYKNRPGVSKEAFQKALRRELNLWKYWSATPNSDFFGATPDVFEMSDLESNTEFFVDGLPTQKFKELVHQLSIKYPMTWGFFEYEKAFWDADGILGHQGFNTLPRQFDATPVAEQYLESGIADGNDLFVFKPKEDDAAVDFATKIKIRGRQRTTRTEYIPLTFQAKVYATAAEDLWVNPRLTGNFTIELTVIDNSATPASPSQDTYYCNTSVSATNDTDFFHATPTSGARSLVEWTTADGYTDISFNFKNKLTGASFGSTQIPLSMVTQVVIKPGHYNGNFATPSYTNSPTQSTYKVWFDGETSTVLGLNGSSVSLTKAPYYYVSHFGSFWFESQSVLHPAATPNSWKSEEYLYTITLNGQQPEIGIKNFTLLMPTFVFPASTSSRSLVVELITNNGGTNYGAFSDALASTPIFIPSSYIAVDGNATWTSNYKKTLSTSTTSIVFSTTTGSSYPVASSVWNIYEKSITTSISGRVDMNGPWKYNAPAPFGNTNYLLSTLSLTRDSFGIPDTTNFILTWIGVESVTNSDRVISWFDTNTIKPAVTDAGETNTNYVYPDNAVIETLNLTTNKYEFSSLNLFARLKPGVNQKWNPKVHSGWFHDDKDEYYLYASPNTELATASTHILKTVNRQGAPLIVDKNTFGYYGEILLKDAVLYLNADASVTGERIAINQGTGGSALNATYGSTGGADANDPLLLQHTGTNYVYLPGIAGNYIITPDEAALDLATNIEVEVDITITDITSLFQVVMSRDDTASSRNWAAFSVYSASGVPAFQAFIGGVMRDYICPVVSGVSSGTRHRLRYELTVNNGGGSSLCTFRKSLDSGVTWTFLGTATLGFTGSMPALVQRIDVGQKSSGANLFVGNIYQTIMRNGIGGTSVVNINCATNITNSNATSFTATTGQTVTVNRSATGRKVALVTRPIWLFGTDDILEISDNGLLDFDAADSATLIVVVRRHGALNVSQQLYSKSSGVGSGIELRTDSSSSTVLISFSDGVNFPGSFAPQPASGTLYVATGIRDVAGDRLIAGVNNTQGTPGTDTTSGSLANAGTVRIGAAWNGANALDAEVLAVAVFRRALTTSEMQYIYDYIMADGARPLYNPATPISMRQVAFFNSDATPLSLTTSNKETVKGNGTQYLKVAYRDIYSISVTNKTTGRQSVSISSTSSTSNIVTLSQKSNTKYEYEITYTPNNSFYLDNDYSDTLGIKRGKVVFDKSPASNLSSSYSISYETSVYDPATPVDIPLNPLYTSIEEGFIYIDHEVHSLNQVEVTINPTKIVADGYDYAVVTLRSYDTNGNPKPYQTFNLYTNFGVIENASVTTDRDGFAFTTLSSNRWLPSTPAYPATPALAAATPGSLNQGLLLVDGGVDARLGFEIQIPLQDNKRIVAVMDSDYILANGSNATYILGRVETARYGAVPYAYVYWRKSRSLYDLFSHTEWSVSDATPGSSGISGRVVCDVDGRFSIGPFKSSVEAGYWLASIESNSASPSGSFTLVGDVVYWYEHPNVTNGIDPITQMPVTSIQSATPYWQLPAYTYGSAFPTTYDESKTQAGYNNSITTWTPPKWYAIDKYKQYQMGVYGSQYDTTGATPIYPEYKEL